MRWLSSLNGVLGAVPSTAKRPISESQYLGILVVVCSPHKISLPRSKEWEVSGSMAVNSSNWLEVDFERSR
jgi:hypothetical protein